MLISELARQSGLSPRMLRYYEEQGLIRPQRLASGYRDYHRADIQRLKHIQALQDAGMTLLVIRRVLPSLLAVTPAPGADAPLVQALRKQRGHVLQAMLEQRRALAIIDQYLAALGQLDPLPVANDALSGVVAHIS